MSILAAALVVGAVSGLVLGTVRRGTGGEEARGALRRAAMAASFACGGAAMSASYSVWLSLLAPVLRPGPDMPPLPLVGLTFGTLLYLHVRVLLADVSRWSFQWAVHAPERFDRTWRMEARNIAWGTAGWALGGAALSYVTVLEGTAFSLAALPLVAAIFPLYETWLHPWLQYGKSRRLRQTRHERLDAWLAELAERHRLPRFHVRVHEGMEKNAFAMGGLIRNLVVVGGGLAAAMTTMELKAVLAHEIAHVVRRDVLKLLATIVAGATCHVFVLIHFVLPYEEEFSAPWAFLIGGAYVAICAPLVYVVLPGLVSRRAEFGADRLAANLLGDAMPMVRALRRLHDLRNLPLDRKSITHPTGADRIAALEALKIANVGG